MLKIQTKKALKYMLAIFLCIVMLVLLTACSFSDSYTVADDADEDDYLDAEDEKEDDEDESALEQEETVEEVVKEPEGPSAAELYTEYLINGGFEILFGENYFSRTNYIELYSYLADIDYDGTDELYIKFVDTEYMGVRGYQQLFYFLDINNGSVIPMIDAYYGGGSMGGDELTVLFDKQTGKMVPALTGLMRDGASASSGYTIIYSAATYEKEITFEMNYINDPKYYGDEIERIKNETSLYTEKEGSLIYYKRNDSYISSSDYEALDERFKSFLNETDLYKGTFEIPVEIK